MNVKSWGAFISNRCIYSAQYGSFIKTVWRRYLWQVWLVKTMQVTQNSTQFKYNWRPWCNVIGWNPDKRFIFCIHQGNIWQMRADRSRCIFSSCTANILMQPPIKYSSQVMQSGHPCTSICDICIIPLVYYKRTTKNSKNTYHLSDHIFHTGHNTGHSTNHVSSSFCTKRELQLFSYALHQRQSFVQWL